MRFLQDFQLEVHIGATGLPTDYCILRHQGQYTPLLEGGLLHAAIECGQRRQRYLVFLTAKNILHIYLLDTSLAPLDHAMLGFCGDPQISHFELLQGNRLSFRLPSEEGIAWRLTLWAIPWLRWTIWSLLFPANREVWRPYKRWLRPYFGIERLISSATSTKEQ